MSFSLLHGSSLVHAYGAGSTFDVALVELHGQLCVCKRVKSSMLGHELALRALEREATLLELARHPSLPRLIDRGQDDYGPYLLESWLEAMSMRELVDGWKERGRGVPDAQLLELMRGAFSVLRELHEMEDERGRLELVHGDLGPDHLMLGRAGRLFLVDFGQARWRGIDSTWLGAGERGTLPYVAPEVARGEQPPAHSHDSFALAATFAYMALGRDPCREEGSAARLVELAERGLDLDAIAECGLAAPLRQLLLDALAFDPTSRLSRPAAILERLAQLDDRDPSMHPGA